MNYEDRPDDCMPDIRVLRSGFVKAAKEHVCGHCGKPIEKGRTHFVAVVKDYDERSFLQYRSHGANGECLDYE